MEEEEEEEIFSLASLQSCSGNFPVEGRLQLPAFSDFEQGKTIYNRSIFYWPPLVQYQTSQPEDLLDEGSLGRAALVGSMAFFNSGSKRGGAVKKITLFKV